MPVSLHKPYALEVATVTGGFNGTTHEIRGGWSYFRTNYTVCGRKAGGKLSRLSYTSKNHTLPITCRSCHKAK